MSSPPKLHQAHSHEAAGPTVKELRSAGAFRRQYYYTFHYHRMAALQPENLVLCWQVLITRRSAAKISAHSSRFSKGRSPIYACGSATNLPLAFPLDVVPIVSGGPAPGVCHRRFNPPNGHGAVVPADALRASATPRMCSWRGLVTVTRLRGGGYGNEHVGLRWDMQAIQYFAHGGMGRAPPLALAWCGQRRV